MGESDKVSNSSSWKYLNEFIIDVIKSQGGGTQEIPTPPSSSFMEIHGMVAVTQTPDRFRD